MIARLTNGPAIAEGNLDIVQPTLREPEAWLRMAPVGGAHGWARLQLDAPPWEGEAVYELASVRSVEWVDADEVFLYVYAPTFTPTRVWQGKGGAARQRLRIVELRRDGSLVFERIAGSAREALRKPGSVLRVQLEAAFEPTEDFDGGEQ